MSKNPNGAAHWLGTWNSPPDDYRLEVAKTGAHFIAAQLEKEGNLHAHFYLWFKKTVKSKRQLRQILPKVHFDEVKGKDGPLNAYNYCTYDGKPADKKHTVIQGSQWEFGTKPIFGKACGSSNYDETLQNCKDGRWEDASAKHQVLYLSNLVKLTAHYSVGFQAPGTRGTWIYGATGTGKSYSARHNFGNSFFVKGQNKWFDNYRAEPVIILDDFDTLGTCLSHLLKIWGDSYPCHGEIKGASVALRHEHFIITSQYLPEQLWTDQALVDAIHRRFKIVTPTGVYPTFTLEPYSPFNPLLNL